MKKNQLYYFSERQKEKYLVVEKNSSILIFHYKLQWLLISEKTLKDNNKTWFKKFDDSIF